MLQEFLEHLGRQWTEALRQRLDLFGKLVQTHLLLDDLWFHLPTVRHRLHTRGWFRTVGEHWHGVSTRTGLAKHFGERQAIGILWQLCGQGVEGRQGIERRCGQGMRRDLRQEMRDGDASIRDEMRRGFAELRADIRALGDRVSAAGA